MIVWNLLQQIGWFIRDDLELRERSGNNLRVGNLLSLIWAIIGLLGRLPIYHFSRAHARFSTFRPAPGWVAQKPIFRARWKNIKKLSLSWKKNKMNCFFKLVDVFDFARFWTPKSVFFRLTTKKSDFTKKANLLGLLLGSCLICIYIVLQRLITTK